MRTEQSVRVQWNGRESIPDDFTEGRITARTAVLVAALLAFALAILGGASFATAAGDGYPDPVAQL